MLSCLITWQFVYNVLLGTVLVSIPEEFFVFMATLILMGEFEYWKEEECDRLFQRWDYVRVFVPTVISALCSNILRYEGVDSGLITVISIAGGFILIILTGDLWGDAKVLKWIGRAFLYLMIVALSVGVIDLIYTPFFLYSTGKTIAEIQNNIPLFFVMSLPSRAIEYTILVFLIAKKRTILKASIINLVFESKILTTLSFIVLTANTLFLLLMMRIVAYKKALESLPFDLKIIIIVTTFMFPIVNISIFFWSAYYVKNREAQKQKNLAEKLRILSEDIKLYTNEGIYDNIKWKLNGLQKDIECVSGNLYHPPKND